MPITEENLAQFSLYIFNILKNKIDLLWETNAGKLLFRAISGVDIIAWVSDTKLGEMKFLDELAYDSKPFNPPSTAKSDVIEIIIFTKFLHSQYVWLVKKSQHQYAGLYSSTNANFIRPCREHRKTNAHV